MPPIEPVTYLVLGVISAIPSVHKDMLTERANAHTLGLPKRVAIGFPPINQLDRDSQPSAKSRSSFSISIVYFDGSRTSVARQEFRFKPQGFARMG